MGKDSDEALEAIENALDEAELPFSRWLLKLLVEKVLVPVLVPAMTAACTAATGWYVVGQYQVRDQVDAEVEKREAVKDVVELAGEEVTVEELEELWRMRNAPEPMDLEPRNGAAQPEPPPQMQQPLPMDLIEQRIKLEGKTLKR